MQDKITLGQLLNVYIGGTTLHIHILNQHNVALYDSRTPYRIQTLQSLYDYTVTNWHVYRKSLLVIEIDKPSK